MYGVINKHHKVIALHDEYSVCEAYAESIRNDQQTYQVVKLKKHRLKGLTDLDEYYLVNVGDIYVQRQFVDSYSIASAQVIEDNKRCIEILLRFLECTNLTPKEAKTIKRCIQVISEITSRDNRYTPAPEELKQLQDNYDAFMRHMSDLD